jgi:ATPase subunit of ABC transporter with duplicated ATPase domains
LEVYLHHPISYLNMLNKFTDLWFGKPNLNPTALPDSLNTSTGPSDEEQFQIAELEATTCFQPSSGCSTGHHCANLADQKSIQSAHGGRTEASQCDFAQEILIAVFGMTGTGKTTLIEKISGQSLAVGHNLRSCKQHDSSRNYPVSFIIDIFEANPNFIDRHSEH